MRALVGGSIVLGLAVTLPAWDLFELRRDVPAAAATPTQRAGVAGARPAALEMHTGAARHPAGPKPGDVVSGPTLPALAHDGAGSGEAAPGSLVEMRRLVVQASKPSAGQAPVVRAIGGVRELVPGFEAQSEAIASILASEESATTVEPVARLYFAYFNRAPDFEGFNHYISARDAGTPLGSIADEFAGSSEFEARYGSVDNVAFIDRVHENVFGVAPDVPQRDRWLAQLESGAMTRGDVMVAMSESSGFRGLVGNEVYVTMAYAETLQRAPEPAELARWVRYLDAGNPRRAVINELLADAPRK